MKTLLLLLIATISLSAATTTVTDHVYTASGGNATGSLVIKNAAFTSYTGLAIARASQTINLTAGVFTVALEPTPAGVYYEVTYRVSPQLSWTEYWSVPISTPSVGLATVRRSTPSFFVDIAQLNPGTSAKGDLIAFDGSYWRNVSVGGNGSRLEADSSQTAGVRWVSPADPLTFTFHDEFCGDGVTTGNIGSFGWYAAATGTGAAIATVASQANHPCLISLTTGTDNNGTVFLTSGRSTTNGFTTGSDLMSSVWEFQALFKFNSSTLTDHLVNFGWISDPTSAVSDSVSIKWTGGTDTNFQAEACNSSTCTDTDLGVPPVADTWYRFKIYRLSTDSGAVAHYCINDCGTTVAITTNTPTSAVLQFGVKFKNPPAGVTSRVMYLDMISGIYNFGSSRW